MNVQNNTMFQHFPLIRMLVFAFPILLFSCSGDAEKKATGPVHPKVEKLKLPEGFVAEHIFGPSENGEGSWVSMTFDDKGRILASDQYGGIYRLSVPAIGDSGETKIEKLEFPGDAFLDGDTTGKRVSIGHAQGLLYAFNSLYVMVNNRNENAARPSGLYRLLDTDGDDKFDQINLLQAFSGEGGEHGPHAVVLSPDKQSIYVAAGNFTGLPKADKSRLPGTSKIDNIYPLLKDANGHDNTVADHGGWVAKVDPEGKNWEIVSSGFRNQYDLAFNDAGDMFTYDSDMEWDFGLPWYRPTRIAHVTSGSEFGWRMGTEKWSVNYTDNLPGILNIGQGSPTGVMYVGDARFPEKYKDAVFAFDWSFGIIYALLLEPDGATYKVKGEEFISGSPLPLTDGVIGPDGAMYFLTGGRRLDSDMYRVYYKGNKEKPVSEYRKLNITEEGKLRRELEKFHVKGASAEAIEFAWPQLKHTDRYVQYAARVAVENQAVSTYREKALAEKDPVILTQAAVALARQGTADLKAPLISALSAVDYASLTEQQQLNLIRAYELIIARLGDPSAADKAKIAAHLSDHFPAKTNALNRLLSKVLLYIEAPGATEKTVGLIAGAKDQDDENLLTNSSDLIMRNPQYGMDIAGMLSNIPPRQQTYYAIGLINAKTGWTPELRETYFRWFYDAFSYKGGNSFKGFLNNARKQALGHVPKSEYAHLNTISGDSIANKTRNTGGVSDVQPKGPGKRWTLEQAVAVVDSGLNNRDFANGQAMFAATLCGSCHTVKGEGGTSGPDLTQLGTRFSPKDMLEAIIDPNKVISDQYGATEFRLKDGGSVVGRLIKEENGHYHISQNPFAPQIVREVPVKDVASTRLSEVSPMLPGLINRLNNDELRDLIAYLMAGGNPDHELYKSK